MKPQTMEPRDVTDVDLAFGGKMSELMPPKDALKEWEKTTNGHSPWHWLQAEWFFKGLPKDTGFIPKEGIDPSKALRHIAAIQKSWEPKHEDKVSAVSYLLSLWFSDVLINGKSILVEKEK